MPLAVAGIILCFLTGLADISSAHSQEDKQQLEDALHRAAVSCYSIEGFYPPDLAYLEEHYGLVYDEELFFIDYQPIGSNIAPEVTVLPRLAK